MSTLSTSIPGPRDYAIRPTAVWLTLLAWLAVIVALGARGSFVAPPGQPPLSMLIAFAGPMIAFFVALQTWPPLRSYLASLDLRVVTAIHAWRFIGFTFIALLAQGLVPGAFALPAGLGDMTVALAAPWMVIRLIDRPGFVTSKAFLWWNRFGMLDLVVALVTGALAGGIVPALSGGTQADLLARLPVVLIPAFGVPILLMLHVTALIQIRAAQR